VALLQDATVPLKEQKLSDFYLMLASHILWNLWVTTKEDSYFWSAVIPLLYALHSSPANHHIRIILIKFYNLVGKL